MRIAIVEDERSEQLQLIAHLRRYERENGLALDICTFVDGNEIVEPYRAEYDLILMDIEMAFVDGMTAAREIRKVDEDVILLFITNAPQYVMNGYEVDALDYLLKPVSYFALAKRLEKVRKRLARRGDRFLRLRVKGGFQKVDVTHILYVETAEKGVIFHTLDGELSTRSSIREVEAELDSLRFFRCNKCYLVNLAFVDGLIGSDIRVGGNVVQVSRARKKPLLDAMNRYMSENNL